MPIKLRTYKNNRVFGLILKELKKYDEYTIKEIKSALSENEKIYQVLVPVDDNLSLNRFKKLVEGIIENIFKDNYFFDFCSLGLTPLSYTASFIISGELGHYFSVSHRIKEVKK